MHFSRTWKTHAAKSERERERESGSMTASAVASLIRELLRCRCAHYLVNLDQWELPARSCAADMPLCLTRLRRWHEETHWHQVNTYSHAWTHVRTHTVHAYVHKHTNTHTHTHRRRRACFKTGSTSAQTPSITLHSVPACLTQSPCSRPEINR